MPKKPTILSPINSFEGAERVIRAGADELYCDVRKGGKLKNFTLFRDQRCEIPTYDELGKIVCRAHEHKLKVILVANRPFMAEVIENDMKNHLRLCLDKGVDGLIVGDIGVMSIVKDMGVDLPIYASTFLAAMNSEAVDFLTKLGFTRVILERHMTMEEISKIVNRSKVDIEVFIHGGGCSNINVSCYFYHHRALSLYNIRQPPCMLSYEVYDIKNEGQKRTDRVHILDGFTWCSICRLPTLLKTGIAGVKIVGRCFPAEFQENATKIYREAIDLLWHRNVRPKRLSKTLSLLRKRHAQREAKSRVGYGGQGDFREYYCKQKRCYYSSLFHAPYKIWSKYYR